MKVFDYHSIHYSIAHSKRLSGKEARPVKDRQTDIFMDWTRRNKLSYLKTGNAELFSVAFQKKNDITYFLQIKYFVVCLVKTETYHAVM